MRISDWSSDVCSSDLRSGRAGLLRLHPAADGTIDHAPPWIYAARRALLNIMDWAALTVSLRLGVLTVLILLPIGIALGRLLAFRAFAGKGLAGAALALPLVQIGRASCRERVCQYV